MSKKVCLGIGQSFHGPESHCHLRIMVVPILLLVQYGVMRLEGLPMYPFKISKGQPWASWTLTFSLWVLRGRVEGWAEARALSHALSGLQLSFEDLKVPTGLLARPLQRNELRVANQHNQFFIYNKETKTLTSEIPPHIQLDKVKALISVSDQGPTNRAALHFLAYGPPATQLMLGLQWDVFHR